MAPNALATLFDIIDTEEAGLGEAGPARFNARTGSETSRDAAQKAGQAIDELLDLPGSVRDLALETGGWSFAGPGVRTMPLMTRTAPRGADPHRTGPRRAPSRP
ncbi:MAG: hypothetical protein JKP95_01770 [Oceanicaulis sp.]|nr:hypothetical protein [Oceanicaulis sp.]